MTRRPPGQGGAVRIPVSRWRRVAHGTALVPLRRRSGVALRLALVLTAVAAAAGASIVLGRWPPGGGGQPSLPWADSVRTAVDGGALGESGAAYSGTAARSAGAPPAAPAAISTTPAAETPTLTAPTETPLPRPAVPPAATARPPTPVGPTVHVVRPGENLTRIAQTYGTSVDAIVRANRIPDRDLVAEGTRLIIPR